MNTAIAEVNISDAAKPIELTIKVKGRNALRARLWLGARFLRLGAWIIGVGRCEIIEE